MRLLEFYNVIENGNVVGTVPIMLNAEQLDQEIQFQFEAFNICLELPDYVKTFTDDHSMIELYSNDDHEKPIAVLKKIDQNSLN